MRTARRFLPLVAVLARGLVHLCLAQRVLVSSSDQIFSALSDPAVEHISLASDIILRKEVVAAGSAIRLAPGRRVFIDSKDAAGKPSLEGWRLLDFSFLSNVIHLSHNVTLTFTNVIIGGTRAQRLLSYPGTCCAPFLGYLLLASRAECKKIYRMLTLPHGA